MKLQDLDEPGAIAAMVRSFYKRVLTEPKLAGYFLEVDWDQHLPVMIRFWEQILLGNPAYEGNPMAVHQRLHERIPLVPEAFDLWVALFLDNLKGQWEGPVTEKARQRGLSIATVMQHKLLYGEPGIQLS